MLGLLLLCFVIAVAVALYVYADFFDRLYNKLEKSFKENAHLWAGGILVLLVVVLLLPKPPKSPPPPTKNYYGFTPEVIENVTKKVRDNPDILK